jgi:hypothetical protein
VKFYAPEQVGANMNADPRVAAVFAMLFAGVVSAHHSYAMFDRDRQAMIRGSVSAVEWTNPHVWIWVVADDSTDTTTYALETLSPGELTRFFGWAKSSVSVGDKITVEYAPLRSGKNGGAVKKITLVDGRVIQLIGGGPAHPATGSGPGGS